MIFGRLVSTLTWNGSASSSWRRPDSAYRPRPLWLAHPELSSLPARRVSDFVAEHSFEPKPWLSPTHVLCLTAYLCELKEPQRQCHQTAMHSSSSA